MFSFLVYGQHAKLGVRWRRQGQWRRYASSTKLLDITPQLKAHLDHAASSCIHEKIL